MLKKILLICTTTALLLSMTACGVRDLRAPATSAKQGFSSEAMDKSAAGRGETSQQVDLMQENAESPSPTSAVTERKVIRNASFTVETKDYDATVQMLNDKLAETKSYAQHSEAYGDKDKGNASLRLTMRVPADQYDAFKQFIETIGNVTHSSEGGEDVTTEYFDTEARLTVLRAQEKRILQLLENAVTIEELLQIENELSRIRTEIEQLTTVIKRYDDLVSYATIEISLSQTSDYTAKDDGFFSRIGRTISDSFSSFLGVLQNAILAIFWLLPYLLIGGIIFLICWKTLRKHPKNKNRQAAPPQPETDKKEN